MDLLHAAPSGRDNTRSTQLTRAGESSGDQAPRLAAAHVQSQQPLDNGYSAKSDRLKLVGSASVMPVVLPALVREIKRQYGCATLEVDSTLSPEVRRSVLEGESAMGVCVDVEQHPALRYTPVLEAQLGLLVSPQLPLPKIITCLDDLAGVPLLKFGDGTSVCQLLRHHRIDFARYFSSPWAVNCILASFDVTQQGQAAVVCSGVAASHARASGLRFIPLPGLLPVARIWIVSRQDALFDPAQEKLRHLVRQCMHDTGWEPSVRRIRPVEPPHRAMRSANSAGRLEPGTVRPLGQVAAQA